MGQAERQTDRRTGKTRSVGAAYQLFVALFVVLASVS